MLAVLAACLLAVLAVFFGHAHMPTSLGVWVPPLI
jgi:hypothetical protein